jgi:hypothetical protein
MSDQPSTSEERFCLHIDYDKGAHDPARIFHALAGMIEAFESFDRHLLRPISTSYKPVFMLEDFEVSSLKTWIVARLEELDDEHIKDLSWKKIVGQYALQSKYAAINFLTGKSSLSSQEEVKQLEAAIEKAAEESGIKSSLDYNPPNTFELLSDVSAIGNALAPLAATDKIAFVVGAVSTDFNVSFRLAPETIEELTTNETLRNISTAILKVRRPDFVGDTQWEFKHGTQTLKAKIEDKAWLAEFHGRRIDVRPGDALRVTLESIVNYDFNNEVSSTMYTIITVERVISADEPDQARLEF